VVPSLQGRAPAEDLQKVCLCQGWAVTQEGLGGDPADVSEVGTCISQADTRAYKFVNHLTFPLLQAGSVQVTWHKKSGGR